MKQKTIRIAIADDHTMFREGLISSMKPYKHIGVLFDAADGEELIEKLSTAKQLPDICILDISMKPMNGYDTAKAITGKWPAIKILALSMFDDDFCMINMLRNGARGYITKDRETEILVKALEQLHEKGFYHDSIDSEILAIAIRGEATHLSLSERETEFLPYCCSELTYREIAGLMHVSERSVEAYRDSLFRKLKIQSRAGLVLFAMLTGLGPVKRAMAY